MVLVSQSIKTIIFHEVKHILELFYFICRLIDKVVNLIDCSFNIINNFDSLLISFQNDQILAENNDFCLGMKSNLEDEIRKRILLATAIRQARLKIRLV
jgi:hypothetical protein